MDLNIDIKAKIDELVKKLQGDPALLKSFQGDPVKTLEKMTGVNLPDEQLKPLVAGIKAKLGTAQLGNSLDGLKNCSNPSAGLRPANFSAFHSFSPLTFLKKWGMISRHVKLECFTQRRADREKPDLPHDHAV